jgi:ABC-type transporter Mla MlaB component
MLRITVMAQTARETTLKVEGWVTDTHVELLAQEVARRLRQGERLVLDLQEVRAIDPAGLELLQHWSGKGLSWRGAGPYVQMLLEKQGLA